MKISRVALLIGIIVMAWASLFITALNQDQRIRQIVNAHTTIINDVENNQKTNALAIKTYIACLLDLNLTQTQAQINAYEQTCFTNAPEVK